ncbi:NAD(P)-dependent oxidoreductase [Levilinea saccharolytica]|uniref:3-phosphoglycerate dehydrogenase n=1 Tax=Levilinea saccharolytica TaxID=229921 RepID=A0A0P6XM34_9CHLR|nr:NAD(P)-dependent oxidoreductase [Levilinea saccharolytica]KPL77400.1 3-phosphoglycerate dehydrogenase [Levilinea saccharolytica]GAP18747.1 phosphoglycerate dehydrogenase [Levilinea saccharolytica]
MTKVLVATDKPFAKVAVAGIRKVVEAAGFELALLEKYTEVSQFLAAVADADALIVRSDLVTAEVLDAAKQLKIVVRAGAGFDNIDLEAATKHGVVVMNTPGQNSNAVAELAFEMMLYQARGGFAGKSGFELRGKTLGLHAFGYVGKCMAAIAKGFGMQLFAYDPFLSAEDIAKEGVTPVASAEELYEKCQYVSLHMPANAKTKLSINHALLSRMPKGATLVNTARAEVIHEEDLLRVFEERPDFVYLSDVAPICKADIEAKYPGRFLFTAKKMGAQTEEANTNAGIAAAEQIRDFIVKGDKRFQVNK